MQELFESRHSRPWLPVLNSLCGLCGGKITKEEEEEGDDQSPGEM